MAQEDKASVEWGKEHNRRHALEAVTRNTNLHLVGQEKLDREPLNQFIFRLKSIGEILGYALLLANNTAVDDQLELVLRGRVTDHKILQSKYVEVRPGTR